LRMRELAVQMENGIYTAKDRDNAQLEVNALLAEVDKIANNTRFNDVKVLDGSYDQTIRAGNTNAETIRVSVGSMKTADNAKLTSYAVEKAGFSTGSAVTTGTNTTGMSLTVNATTSAQINTLSLADSTFKEVFKGDSLGEFKLTGSGGSSIDSLFTIDAKTGELTSKAAIANTTTNEGTITFTYTPRTVNGVAGTAHTFTINLSVSDGQSSTLSGIKVENTVNAGHAIESLDKALEEVSTAQAKLGAIQNRLSHNIDNLSKSSMLTEQSVGRIVDADFATETSELSKQQILAQAATSMLAQANQSKQSVLALLQ